jgi:hypothetical protein
VSRKSKIRELMTKDERAAFKLAKRMLKDGPWEFAVRLIDSIQRSHEDKTHDGLPCMESRVAAVAAFAVQFDIESVEEFAEVEMLAAKIRAGEDLMIHGG